MVTTGKRKPPLQLEEMSEHADDAAGLLKALANKNRLMVLCILAGGELSVTELLSKVPLSQSALSQHLAVLRNDGLVETRRQSQTIYYSLADHKARQVIELLHSIYCEI
ncbi:MAG: helix-turn-helix transcriptional regulator [Pseudomonadales bacterium]|nr:helix-turn-helix transcriptional regulator [Pseudomonadales bacterium]